jgi:hypothetical protein
MDKEFVVVIEGNYTGMEFVYGPYTEQEANKVLSRMESGQTMHTTKSIRKHNPAADVIFCPKV